MDTDPNRWYSDQEIIAGIQKGRETANETHFNKIVKESCKKISDLEG